MVVPPDLKTADDDASFWARMAALALLANDVHGFCVFLHPILEKINNQMFNGNGCIWVLG